MNKQVYLAGVIASSLYAVFMASSFLLWPGYNHFRDSISAFTSMDSPFRDLFDWLLTISGLALLVFSVGMAKIWQRAGNKKLEISGTLLIVYSMANLPIKYFHMDQFGSESSFRGIVYLILIAVTTLSSILAIFYSAFGFAEARGGALKIFSIVAGMTVAFSGLISAINYTQVQSYYGLFERITIFSFFAWVFVVALDLFLIQNHWERSLAERV